MIIKSQNLDMVSSREYSSKRTESMSITQGNGPDFLKFLGGDIYNPQDGKSYCLENGDETCGIYDRRGLFDTPDVKNIGNKAANRRNRLTDGVKGMDDTMDFMSQSLQVQFKSLNYLLHLFFGKQFGGQIDLGNYLNSTGGRYQAYSFTETYEESETTSFSTTGTVVTEDGRELNFDLNIQMSRSFYQESNLSYIREQNPLIDPLVIHLDGNVDAVSDQTFYFDLDGDGEEEEISRLNAGSGFLALDENEDGVINDGNELFGTHSGDGFGDLARFDLDGNGWIDEADDVFDRLRIFSFDENGQQRLTTLKESNIGAICLQSAPTRFSLNDDMNRTNAVVRATGFFLREDTGLPGAIQQIDFAKSA